MNRRARMMLTAGMVASAVLILSGCQAPGQAEPSPVGDPSTAPVSTASPESSATTSASTAPSSPGTPTAGPTSSGQQGGAKLQGEAGGGFTVGGTTIKREDASSFKALKQALGDPEQEVSADKCGDHPLSTTNYRWGDLRVTVLNQEDPDNDYGFSYPVGGIAGWLIDPTLDGEPGLATEMTGPHGTTIGTPLSTLQSRFREGWDYAALEDDGERRSFAIYSGDTSGAVFELGADDKVASMWAGYNCSS